MQDEPHELPESTHRTTDPRLEIPEVLRTPVKKPASMLKQERKKQQLATTSPMAVGFAMASDFIFSILGGVGLGWVIDYFAGTAPYALIIGLVFGFVSGFWRIIKQSRKMNQR